MKGNEVALEETAIYMFQEGAFKEPRLRHDCEEIGLTLEEVRQRVGGANIRVLTTSEARGLYKTDRLPHHEVRGLTTSEAELLAA